MKKYIGIFLFVVGVIFSVNILFDQSGEDEKFYVLYDDFYGNRA